MDGDRRYVVLTAVGPDRPGLVNQLSSLIREAGASIEDSRMAILGGEFAMILLVSTIEPCPMCAGAALAARITTVVFGAPDPKAGACGSLYNLGADPRLNHDMAIVPGVREAEAAGLIRRFFAERRSPR